MTKILVAVVLEKREELKLNDEQVVKVEELEKAGLADDTIVMPGHGLDTTIGTERPALPDWVDRGW